LRTRNPVCAPASHCACCRAVACRTEATAVPSSGPADSALAQLLQMNPGDVMQRLDALLQEVGDSPPPAGGSGASTSGAAPRSAGGQAQGQS